MTESSSNHRPAACPEWCVVGDHTDDREIDEQLGDGPLHKGPLFGGLLRGWGLDDGDQRRLSVDVEAREDFTSAAQLHALAAAAEEAAIWLDEAAR